MSTQGFPDWQENVPALGFTPVDVSGYVAAGTNNFNIGYVGGYEDTIVTFTPVAGVGGFLIAVGWYADLAVTQLVGSVVLETFGLDVVRQKLGNIGPYLFVSVIPIGASLGTQFAMVVQPRKAIRVDDPAFIAQAIKHLAVILFAGATSTTGMGYVFARTVQISWVTDAAAFVIKLTALSSAGAAASIPFAIDQATAGQRDSRLVSLPANHVDLAVTNNDAVARSFDVSIVPAF